MKLFVWNGDEVLTDWSSGMIVAIGADLQDALLAVEEAEPHAMDSFPNHKPDEVLEIGPAVRKAWICWGGS